MENEEKDGIITKPPPRDGVVSSFEKWLNSLEQPTRGAQVCYLILSYVIR